MLRNYSSCYGQINCTLLQDYKITHLVVYLPMNKGIIFNSKIVLTSGMNRLKLLETLYSWKVGMSRLKIPYRFLLYCIVLVSLTPLDAAFWNRVCLNVRNKMTSTTFMPVTALKESQRVQVTHSTRKKTGSEAYSKRLMLTPGLSFIVRRALPLYKEIPSGMKGIPLSHDAEVVLSASYRDDSTFLPRLYTALDHVTGASDDDYDPFKGSFSFKFHLDVHKYDSVSQYLYWMMQYRTFMRLKVYHIVPRHDPREEEVYTRPSDHLFSTSDIRVFTRSFVESLLDDIRRDNYVPTPFVKGADSDCFLFGYEKEGYFAKRLKDFETYEAEKEKLERIMRNNNRK